MSIAKGFRTARELDEYILVGFVDVLLSIDMSLRYGFLFDGRMLLPGGYRQI